MKNARKLIILHDIFVSFISMELLVNMQLCFHICLSFPFRSNSLVPHQGSFVGTQQKISFYKIILIFECFIYVYLALIARTIYYHV